MAIHNTYHDSANTAVRAFLTKVGAYYNNQTDFNTHTGKGKKTWEQIKSEFDYSCCYCGKKADNLTMEHLVMFNRKEGGLHHPENVVPCCIACNKRTNGQDKKPIDWRKHLKTVAKEDFEKRLKRIEGHIKKYKYPELTAAEQKAIIVIAESLYKNTLDEGARSYTLYLRLREEFASKELSATAAITKALER